MSLTIVGVCGSLIKKKGGPVNETYLSGVQKQAGTIREKEKIVLVPEMRPRMAQKVASILLTALLCAGSGYAEPVITEASYYTVASCMKESGQAIMANGRALDDNKNTAASWEYSFGTRLLLRNCTPGKNYGRSTIVVVTDRGPAKRLVKKGRRVDLSRKAFTDLEPDLRKGLIKVSIEEVR